MIDLDFQNDIFQQKNEMGGGVIGKICHYIK